MKWFLVLMTLNGSVDGPEFDNVESCKSAGFAAVYCPRSTTFPEICTRVKFYCLPIDRKGFD